TPARPPRAQKERLREPRALRADPGSAALAEAPHLVPEEVERRRDHQRDRLRQHLGGAEAADEQLQHREVDREGEHADGEEARGLEARVTVLCAEGPMSVQPEVVCDGDKEGDGRGHQVMDVEPHRQQGEHSKVKHRAGPAHAHELEQLDPVVAFAETITYTCVNRYGLGAEGLFGGVHWGATWKWSSTIGVTSSIDHCCRSFNPCPVPA